MTVEAPRLVVCAKCDEPFKLSARNVRMNLARGTEPTCEACRHPAKPRTSTREQREWWLERFTLDEIREFAEALWPT